MTTLRELKQGALLHTLIALLLLGKPTGKDAIRKFNGWSDEAVQDALDVLEVAPYGLVVAIPNGRHPLWALTATAKQMLLPVGQALPAPYVALTPLAAESGVHSPTTTTDLNKPPLLDQERLTPLRAESDYEFADATARLLCKLGGVLYHDALAAVNLALEAGDTQADVKEQIKAWSGWLGARGLVEGMGASIARNIRNGDLCEGD